MLRIIVLFALLALVSAAFAFGWIGDAEGSEVALVLFWICATLCAALALRAIVRPRAKRG
jgi:uncharacterized membrane protein YtjA (UPF0391 family)